MPTQKGGTNVRKSTRLSGDNSAAVIVEENPSAGGGDNILSSLPNNNNNLDLNIESVANDINVEPSGTNTELEAIQKLQRELDKLQGSSSGQSSIEGNTILPSGQTISSNTAQAVGTQNNTMTSTVSALAASHGQTVQLLKRPASSTQAPVMTKVIITTKNATGSQLQTVAVSGTQGVSLPPKFTGASTPTKSVTVPLTSLVSPLKNMVSTPMKQTVFSNKVTISPAKTPGKITMIPISKSPQRIAPALSGNAVMVARTVASTATTITSSKPQTITMSPSRVVIRQQPATPVAFATGQLVKTSSTNIKQIAMPTVTTPGVQQIQVPGSKFHYVRLVTAPASQSQQTIAGRPAGQSQIRSIAPATGITASAIPTQVKLTVPSNITTTMAGQTGTQRLLLPANPTQIAIRTSTQTTSQTQIKPVASVANLQSLPPGTAIISSGTVGQGIPGFALVPAQYVTQLQQLNNQQTLTTTQTQTSVAQQKKLETNYIPIMSNDPSISNAQQNRRAINGSSVYDTPGGARPRKPCNCTKSQCLKLYCDCFANGEFCHNCNCNGCFNNLEHEEDRAKAIKSCLDRNPHAFHPKIGKAGHGEGERKHQKGCNCKRSNCLKNYCECYEAKIMCSAMCKCVGCKNFEESPERKTLMNLADAAEVRSQQQTAAKSKLSSQIQDLPSRPTPTSSGERLPYSFVTEEVAEATCACLVAQAEESERTQQPTILEERLVLEEFGRCLMQVIDSANKTKLGDSPN